MATARLTRVEKQAETRQRLLDAAGEVFMRRGFEAASIEEITAEAGFTRGAFYSNFDSKEEMFVELLQERVYARFTDLLMRIPQDASPLEQLRWATRELVEGYRETEGSWLYTLFLGVHASIEGGMRSATLRAATRCRIVVIPEDVLDQSEVVAIASGQRREQG